MFVWSRLHGVFFPELGILLLSPISNGANWFYSTGFRTPRYAPIRGFHLVHTCLIHLNHKTMHTVLILKGSPLGIGLKSTSLPPDLECLLRDSSSGNSLAYGTGDLIIVGHILRELSWFGSTISYFASPNECIMLFPVSRN